MNHEAFARDIVRFFTHAITVEHIKRLESESRIIELENRVAMLEEHIKSLEDEAGTTKDSSSLFGSVRKKLRQEGASKHALTPGDNVSIRRLSNLEKT